MNYSSRSNSPSPPRSSGADSAYFRVHHFARQLASPFPLLVTFGVQTGNIEIGSGIIDMSYDNSL
tara:strand:- start:191 stop:385 length:195 start_codon:yes stop_codon:yes gene_type:complete